MAGEGDMRPMWDRNLTEDEVAGLSKTMQRLRNDASLRRKVDFHKHLSKNPDLLRQYQAEVAWNPSQLRKLSDPVRLFWPWKNKLIDQEHVGRNRDLMKEWRDALSAIQSVLGNFAEIKDDTIDRAEASRADAIRRQNAELIARVVSLEIELERIRQTRR